jgi:hypothetical protein
MVLRDLRSQISGKTVELEVQQKNLIPALITSSLLIGACFLKPNKASISAQSEIPKFTESVSLDVIERALQSDESFSSPEDFLAWFLKRSEGISFQPSRGNQLIFLYQSRSTQNASLEKPRMIVSVDRGRFAFTLTGHVETRSDNSVEIFEGDPETGRYKFARLEFPQQKAALNRNSSLCTECHGTTLRPIWDSYPFWPGVYGSVDRLVLNRLESENWEKFVKLSQEIPRYRPLSKHIQRFALKHHSEIPHEQSSNEFSLSQSNTEFGKSVSRYTHKRIEHSQPSARRGERFAHPLLESSGNFGRLVTRGTWMRHIPLRPIASHLVKPGTLFPYDYGFADEKEPWNQDLTRAHKDLIRRIHEDKRTRAKISGVSYPFEPGPSDSYDTSASEFVFAFLGSQWIDGHDVTSWSNAMWHGRREESELQDILLPLKENGARESVQSTVFLFEDGGYGVLGLKQLWK